ncbi:MAG: ribonuclease HII [Microthrixaceae bacterium]|nr:ribonuclease HII [Microthrixaceae bacterium]MCO5317400.1 ribonuclease HII [Microthrixaceae bacterium]
MSGRRRGPTLAVEKRYWEQGADVVVGLDEVGRGAWAGPLTIAAVVLPRDRRVYGVRDSKQLTEARREQLFERIVPWCRAVGVGHAGHDECDRLGMSDAQRLAASRALDALGEVPDAILLDGPWDFVGRPGVETIVKGDRVSLSIAAASIVAKVTRDRRMREAATDHPGFDFERNKGYPCPRHKLALKGYGPTAIHRRSWSFMDNLPWLATRVTRADPQGRLFEATSPGAVPAVTGPTW